jgi:hypothetical protein
VIGLPALGPAEQAAVLRLARDFVKELVGVERVSWHADVCDRTCGVLPRPPSDHVAV